MGVLFYRNETSFGPLFHVLKVLFCSLIEPVCHAVTLLSSRYLEMHLCRKKYLDVGVSSVSFSDRHLLSQCESRPCLF